MFDFLLRNPGLKLLAIVIAVLIWISVSGPRREKLVEQTFELPIVFSGVPENLIITGRVEDKATVRLRGSRSTLRSLPIQNMSATIDLTSSRAGEVTLPITEQSLNIPQDVELVSVEPAKITFRLEPLRQKSVLVRPFLVGAVPNGYDLGEVNVVPPQAAISGPSSIVANISEIATERIILTGRAATFTVTVGLVSDYAPVRVIQPQGVQVTVTVIPPPPAPPPVDTTATTTAPATTPPR